MWKKFLLTVIVICCCVPYITTVFYFHTIHGLDLLFVDFICFVALCISGILYAFREKQSAKKSKVLLGAVGTVLLYFLSYSTLVNLADFYFFKKQEEALNNMATQMLASNKIFSLEGNPSKWRSINDYRITYDSSKVDTTAAAFQTWLLQDVLIKEGISQEELNMLGEEMIKLDVFKVDAFDGYAWFMIECFMMDCTFFIYTIKDEEPKINAKRRHRLNEHWYLFAG